MSTGRPHRAGSPGYVNRTAVAPPPLKDGQARCPVCRNAVRLTLGGRLRQHVDLFGHRCWNKATGQPTGIAAPPVRLPPERRPRVPDIGGPDARQQPPIGRCHECDRPVTGERRLCGRCLATRGTT